MIKSVLSSWHDLHHIIFSTLLHVIHKLAEHCLRVKLSSMQLNWPPSMFIFQMD